MAARSSVAARFPEVGPDGLTRADLTGLDDLALLSLVHTLPLASQWRAAACELLVIRYRAWSPPTGASFPRASSRDFSEGLTQAQIGQRLGIAQMHVSRLRARALGRLRARLYGPEPSPVPLSALPGRPSSASRVVWTWPSRS